MNIIYRIFIGSMIFNLLFSSFSYALTTFADSPSDIIDIGIDQESLMQGGLVLVNATDFQLSFNDTWHYYTMNDVRQRVKWGTDLVRGDGFNFQKQSFLERTINTWILPQYTGVWFGSTKSGLIDGYFNNASVITNFDNQKNYTRFNLDTNDIGFIYPIEADKGNITRAIMETGLVNMTIADTYAMTDQSAQGFVKWYWANLFSWEYQGLPYAITVFLKIITFVNLASAIIVIRELFKV